MALTEHIPRSDEDLYPGESEHPHYKVGMYQHFDNYYKEAKRMRAKYASQIKILIGFEGEWIRPGSLDIIRGLLDKYRFDLFIGSVHHVHTIPIDYNDTTYREAREKAGGTDEKLFEDYFDSQYEMLQALQPPVVAHFDLIRLKSDDPDHSWITMQTVWARIMRNLGYIATYGGLLEINTSALRKGLKEPYPKHEICNAFMTMGGHFTLSDDSHGVDHIGTNYVRALEFTKRTGITQLQYLDADGSSTSDGRLEPTSKRTVSLRDLEAHPFWKTQV